MSRRVAVRGSSHSAAATSQCDFRRGFGGEIMSLAQVRHYLRHGMSRHVRDPRRLGMRSLRRAQRADSASRRKTMRRHLILSLLLMLVAVALTGCAARSLSVSNAFSYACAAGGECAVFLTLTNSSSQADTLGGSQRPMWPTTRSCTSSDGQQGRHEDAASARHALPASQAPLSSSRDRCTSCFSA